MEPLTCSDTGNRFIVVFIDYYTKYTEAFAVPDIKATTIADLFIRQIICHHGSPKTLLSDRGTNFTSEIMTATAALVGTTSSFSSAYHPQTNRQVERMNQTLTTRIRIYIDSGHSDWDHHLPFVLFAVNTQQNSSTGYSPFFALFGHEPVLPNDHEFPHSSKSTPLLEYLQGLRQHFELIHTNINATLNVAQKRYKTMHDRQTHDFHYTPG